MLTADTNLVEVSSAVQYTQPDPLKYLFKVKGVEETLTQVSESAMREAVGQASLDKALAFDPSITEHARVLLQRTLDNYDMGIRIISVTLGEVVVPEPVQDAQRDAIKADKDRQRYPAGRGDLPQRRRAARARRGGEGGARRRGLQAAGARARARRDLALRSGARAVRSRAGRDPRAHVSRDHGECLQELPQGHRRYQGRRQHAVSAARQADLGRRRSRSPCRTIR